ncbi:LacI family DNA-binding transcriptional regulator [Brachybacterium phenoliresistens]|uniref:LacI family DNA-binding transcriptional regulator n=1 Tax=Brachybacterium phenoliresistens TaxID=396014 RepID=UPI0031E10FF6
MATTLRDVAARAGVSVATASRALQGSERIGEATRERVRAAAAALAYTPNRTARALSTGRTATLGLIVPDLLNPFFPAVVKGAQARARELGLQLLLADTDESPAEELPLVRTLAPQVDGVILCSSRMDEDELGQAASLTRTVLVNREHGHLPSVVLDPGPGVEAALRHLHALGHTRIGYVGGPATSSSDDRRRRSLAELAPRIGLEVVPLGARKPDAAGGAAAAEELLALRLGAAIVYNDLMALGLMDRLRTFGLDVPRDVSVIGWDDIEFSAMARPALSTVRMPRREAGRTAVDLLGEIIAGGTGGAIRLGTELVLRASTSRAPLRIDEARPDGELRISLPDPERGTSSPESPLPELQEHTSP